MPVLQVKGLPQKDPEKIQPALKKACAAIAEAYGCKPDQVWATWEEIKPGFYVEGESSPETQPVNTHPPIAQLTCFEGKSPEQVESILAIAAMTLSEALGIVNNIFVIYNEAKSGQVISGNGIVRKKE